MPWWTPSDMKRHLGTRKHVNSVSSAGIRAHSTGMAPLPIIPSPSPIIPTTTQPETTWIQHSIETQNTPTQLFTNLSINSPSVGSCVLDPIFSASDDIFLEEDPRLQGHDSERNFYNQDDELQWRDHHSAPPSDNGAASETVINGAIFCLTLTITNYLVCYLDK